MQLRIGTKIAGGFAAVLLLLGFMTCMAIYSLYAAESQVTTLHQTNRRLMLAMKITYDWLRTLPTRSPAWLRS